MNDERKYFTPLAEMERGIQRMNSEPLKEQQITKALQRNDSLTDGLMEQICRSSNLNQAYKRVKANKGSPGVDGMKVNEMRDFIAEHKDALIRSLLNGDYRPQPVRQVEIPKSGGGVRQLGIPTVIDRLVQQAILQILQPLYEPEFSDSSYGFRPGRSAHQAVKKAQAYVRLGNVIVVDMDLKKFFDRVNHDILMSRLAKRIQDKRLLKIIRRFLESGIMQSGVCVQRGEGTPQGGPLSPLLSNVLLDELDKELEKRGHTFCRYADDCNIYVKSQQAGIRVLASIKQFLAKKLRLQVNDAKSGVANVRKRQFLGFRLLQKGKIGLADKALKRLKESVRSVTKRNRGRSFSQVIGELNEKLRGWVNYFKLIETPSKLVELDKWIRRKLRCYRLKQRKQCKSIAAFLIDLGVSNRTARQTASSGKGWWRISKTPALQQAMSNAWFEKQGLINLQKQSILVKV